MRKSVGQGGMFASSGGFKTPRQTGESEGRPSTDSVASSRPSFGGKLGSNLPTQPRTFCGPRGVDRQVYYPEAAGKSQETIISERLAKRAGIDYHTPEPLPSKRTKKEAAAAAQKDEKDEGENATIGAAGFGVALPVKMPAKTDVAATGENGADGDNEEKKADVEEESEPDDNDIVDRFPVSARGFLFFQVETDGASKHETTGIIVINTDECAVQMYDRVGRQHGNRPDPGYPLKPTDIDEVKAGSTLKVGFKQVLVISGLREDCFRSGEFFLRTEHDKRKKEEKKKAKLAAIEALEAKQKLQGKINFGAGFAMSTLRRRPKSTNFVVPVAGRPKTINGVFQSELEPLHDPDRENGLVLFRADYKRDINGRRIVSVVVDPVVGDKLRPHQRIGVQFLYDCVTGEKMPGYFGAILADEMGLGKTIQTVTTIWTCLKQGKFGTPIARKVLVVAPSSLVKNWCNEFDKWLGEGAVKCFAIAESTPKGDRILSRFESEGDVLVISYDQLRKYVDRLSKVAAIELVVCDEGHKLKNAEIKTTKAVDMMPTRRRIILSGTPIQNDLTEFHAMVGFVNPGMLGNLDLFRRVYEEPIMMGRNPDTEDDLKELGAERAHYLANLTQKFILRRTQTINEKYLPAKVDVTVFCRLGNDQQYVYKRISELAEKLSSTPLVLITALKKLCNHVDLLHTAITKTGEGKGFIPKSVLPKGFTPGRLSTSLGSKLQFVSLMLDELVSNGDKDKLVIVSNYTQTLDIIANLCKKKKVAFFQLDGNTPIKRRQELVDRFNVPINQEIVFLLSSKAGGVGLNLIGANRLILFDPDWNPANDAQAMGRVWRDGQKKKVFIYRMLSTGSIEEKIYQRQVSKQGLSANVVDMKEDSKQHFTLDEMRALFTFRPETLCDTYDLLMGENASTNMTKAKELQKKKGMKSGFKKVAGEDEGAPQVAPAPTGGPRHDELRSWDHIDNPAKFDLDKVMQAIAKQDPKLVSFIFANERDASKQKQTVANERAFVADEGQITCTQDGNAADDDEIEFEVIDDDSDADYDE